MQVVILAAGKSSRFIPFSSIPHKSLTSLMGKTILEHMLISVKNVGIKDVIIVVSKKSGIEEIVGNGENLGLKIKYVTQEVALGMGDALLKAKDHLQNKFFVSNGYHIDFEDFAQNMIKLQKNEETSVLLAKNAAALENYGNLIVEGDRVVDIIEKPTQNLENGLHTIGIYLLNNNFVELLSQIPTEQYNFEKALSEFAKKEKVIFLKTEKSSITLKFGWDLLNAKDYLLKKIKRSISKSATIARNAVIDGEVYIDDNVEIFEGACIKGPCYLGKNVVVGNNAVIRGGVIVEDSSVIGANMEIKNSILMKNSTTHSGFIGDSVIGQGCRLAGGFCSANVRFDRQEIIAGIKDKKINTHRKYFGFLCGDHVDCGIGVMTMPGIIIGNNVTIGPSTLVMENIEENTTFYTKFETVRKKKNE